MATQTDDPLTYALVVSLKDHLQDRMVDNIPAVFNNMLAYTDKNGVSRTFAPSLLKIGRLQDDPTALSASDAIPSVGIYIHYNDPSDQGDGWKDSVASAVEASMTNAGFRFPIREIGGGTCWWRRFWLEWEAFYLDADFAQLNASKTSAALKHMLETCINSASTSNTHGWDCALVDPLGEVAYWSEVVKSHLWEGGGPADDYIWRGGVWFQVLTEKET